MAATHARLEAPGHPQHLREASGTVNGATAARSMASHRAAEAGLDAPRFEEMNLSDNHVGDEGWAARCGRALRSRRRVLERRAEELEGAEAPLDLGLRYVL